MTDGEFCTLTTDGFTNRLFIVEEETTLPVVCWNSCESCNPVSLEEYIQLDLDIIPNPSSGEVQLNLASELRNKDGFVTIYSLTGKTLSTQSLLSISDQRLNLSWLNEGLYLIEVRSGEFRSMERLMIQK